MLWPEQDAGVRCPQGASLQRRAPRGLVENEHLHPSRNTRAILSVLYGLYVARGFVSAHLANQTGFGEEDLELLWQSLVSMLEHHSSAARDEMMTRGLYVFKHDSELGNTPTRSLFARIQLTLTDGIAVPRDFSDYTVSVVEDAMPSVVALIRRC